MERPRIHNVVHRSALLRVWDGGGGSTSASGEACSPPSTGDSSALASRLASEAVGSALASDNGEALRPPPSTDDAPALTGELAGARASEAAGELAESTSLASNTVAT
ncbi:MAG: hypothetical protein OHK0013_23910 [Sandaracinaceae bacterium]